MWKLANPVVNEEVLTRCEWHVMVAITDNSTYFSFWHSPVCSEGPSIACWRFLCCTLKVHPCDRHSDIPLSICMKMSAMCHSHFINIFLYLPSSPINISKIWIVSRTKRLLSYTRPFFPPRCKRKIVVWPCEAKGCLGGMRNRPQQKQPIEQLEVMGSSLVKLLRNVAIVVVCTWLTLVYSVTHDAFLMCAALKLTIDVYSLFMIFVTWFPGSFLTLWYCYTELEITIWNWSAIP